MDEYAVILDQARASITAGRTPDWSVLEARVQAVAQFFAETEERAR